MSKIDLNQLDDIQYDVLSYLSEYPSYFEEKAIKLIFG